jgi:hypothetical protein
MDAKPKSNKLKRQEKQRKLELRAEHRSREDARPDVAERANSLRADQALKDSKSLRRDPERLLQLVARGEDVNVPLTSDLHVIARLFRGLKQGKHKGHSPRPDLPTLRRLVLMCRERTDLLAGQGADRYANALLALAAHSGRWVRPLEDWHPRSHNAYKQFHALVRHLIARYDVPTFMNTAWLEGLTNAGVVHQRWFIHVAQGQNIRTADQLPISLTRRQAHLYLTAPDDFDMVTAFRWAQVVELGGDERLVRSILGTRLGTDFAHEEFWTTVFRWLVAQAMLDPVNHGPIIDYIYEQRFVASIPNPEARLPGQPRLVAPQPNLTMKGRSPETLLRSVAEWHRRLGRQKTGNVTSWIPCGLEPLRHEEGIGETRRVYRTTELLTSRELLEEGKAMGHCVGSYSGSCASGRTSIWSLRVADAWDRETRLLTLEVLNQQNQVIQARQKFNKLPSLKELAILRRWSDAGGPSPSKWLVR